MNGVNQAGNQGSGGGKPGKAIKTGKGKKLKTPKPAVQTAHGTSPAPAPAPGVAVPAVSGSQTNAANNVVGVNPVNGSNPSASAPNSSGANASGSGVKSEHPADQAQLDAASAKAMAVQSASNEGVDGVSAKNGKNKKSSPKGEKSCEDQALKEIYKIMNADQNNAFAKMFELTVMRLARKSLAEGNGTFEGYTQNKISDLEKQLNAVKGGAELQKQVKATYETYGKSGDLAKVNRDLDQVLEKGKKACYWSMHTRLWNDDVSSFILATSVADPSSGLKDSDAAIIWAVEKIRKNSHAKDANFNQGGLEGNQLNVSTRVARYLGDIQGGAYAFPEGLDAKILAEENDLNQMIQNAYASVKTSLYSCIDHANPSCTQCAMDQKAKFESDSLGLDKIQRSLASTVAKSENLKMEKSLKGKIGNINFDFNETLSNGAVAKKPERMGKFDACGSPRNLASAEDNTIYNGGTLKEVVIKGRKKNSKYTKPAKKVEAPVTKKSVPSAKEKLPEENELF